MAGKKDNLVKMEIYLTKDNAKIIGAVDTRLVTPSFYLNAVIESTAAMKKFKDMRTDSDKEESKTDKVDKTISEE